MSTTMIAGSSPITRLTSQCGSEAELVTRLVSSVAEDGLDVDRAWIVNCYVAMKSRPLTILAGPQRSGKELLVTSLTRLLARGTWQSQTMLGHAWWAEGTENAALFTEAQVRLNSNKILTLIEQASLPKNADRVFIGWLNRIGPTELAGFFSELAFQLHHKRLMRLPSFHLTEAIAWPPNFCLIGTIDTLPIGRSNDDLFSEAMIIPWPAAAVRPPTGRHTVAPILPVTEPVFLRSCIRSEEAAFDKLHRTQGWQPQFMWPLVVVEQLLRQYGVALPDCAMGGAMIYVANAWSAVGQGLFDPTPGRNLAIALDFALTQSLLLPAGEAIHGSPALHARLTGAISMKFPRSAAFLGALRPTLAHHQTPRREPVTAQNLSAATMRQPAVAHSG